MGKRLRWRSFELSGHSILFLGKVSFPIHQRDNKCSDSQRMSGNTRLLPTYHGNTCPTPLDQYLPYSTRRFLRV